MTDTQHTDAMADTPCRLRQSRQEGLSLSPSAGATDPVLAVIERAARTRSRHREDAAAVRAARAVGMTAEAKQAFDNAIAAAKGEIPSIIREPGRRFHQQVGPGGRTTAMRTSPRSPPPSIRSWPAAGFPTASAPSRRGRSSRVTCRISHAAGYGGDNP